MGNHIGETFQLLVLAGQFSLSAHVLGDYLLQSSVRLLKVFRPFFSPCPVPVQRLDKDADNHPVQYKHWQLDQVFGLGYEEAVGGRNQKVVDYGRCQLSPSVQIKLNEQDIKRARQIAQYPWFAHKKPWQKEIELMLKNGFKLEVEALISKDISYVTEEYVPARLEEADFLD